MPQVDSLTLILLTETVVGLLLCIIIYLVWVLRRKSRDQLAVRDFIERLNEAEEERIYELKQRLKTIIGTSEENLALILKEISQQEKALYKQVIEVFLQQSLSSVIAIENRIRAITEPFYKLLAEAKESGDSTVIASSQNQSQTQSSDDQAARIKQLRFESNQLAEQLNAALETLDEVSSEYSKMFGETKSAEELAASQRKMLNTYRQAELKSRQIIGN